MKKIIIFFLTLNILFAQNGTETLKRIQNKFNTISDFTASFIQYDCTSSIKNSTSLQGKIVYKKKNKYIVELKNQTIISNGETIWNYNKKQKQVIISNLNDEPNTYSIEKIIYSYPSLCNIRYLKKELDEDVIELLPKEGMLDIKNIKIWKDKNDFISKLEITDIGDMCYKIQFSDIIINQNITDSKFTFNPPKGIHVVDLR